MARKLATPTKMDKERMKSDAKLLYFDGRTLEECAKLVQLPYTTVQKWAERESWTEERKRIETLALRMSRNVGSSAKNVAFERARYGKTTHRILAKGARKAAKAWMRQPEEVFIEHAGGFKATVEAAAKLHPESFGEEAGNRFAINLEINSIAHSPECRQLTPEEVREFGEG